MKFQFWAGNPPKNFGQKPLLCGWTDGRMDRRTVIKRVLRFSSFLCMLNIMYICTYIRTQKLSLRFLWVSKFDVKLRVIDKNFKITAGRWIFFFWSKSSLLKPTHEENGILGIEHTECRQPVRTSLPFSPFGVQQGPTSACKCQRCESMKQKDGIFQIFRYNYFLSIT